MLNYILFQILPPPGIKSSKLPLDLQLHSRQYKPYHQPVKELPSSPLLVVHRQDINRKMTYGELMDVASTYCPNANESEVDRESRSWREMRQRSLDGSSVPIYSTLHRTCFEEVNGDWNLSNFTENQSVIHALPRDQWFEGIQTPYIYLGMFLTSFAWHREDRNLWSINYMHEGEPKLWYAIGHKDAEKLEECIQKAVKASPDQFQERCGLKCSKIARHKIIHVPPSFLKKNGIPFGKVSFCVFSNRFFYFLQPCMAV